MEHREVLDHLSPYLDNELDAVSSRELASHLATCASCNAERVRLKRVSEGLRANAGYHRAPEFLRERIVAREPGERQRNDRSRGRLRSHPIAHGRAPERRRLDRSAHGEALVQWQTRFLAVRRRFRGSGLSAHRGPARLPGRKGGRRARLSAAEARRQCLHLAHRERARRDLGEHHPAGVPRHSRDARGHGILLRLGPQLRRARRVRSNGDGRDEGHVTVPASRSRRRVYPWTRAANGEAHMPSDSIPADILIRSSRIHSFSDAQRVARALASRDDSIVALSDTPTGLDGLITPDTHIVDDPSLTWLPAFYDTHNHLLEATRNATFVQVNRAATIAEIIALIREKADRTPPGRWIQSSNAWHEQKLAEGRLPTAKELDEATREHPVLLRRGGHMAVLNSRGLEVSNITPATPDPPGGRLGRARDGSLDGMLEGGAQYALVRVPPPPIEEQVASLQDSCDRFTAAGIGTV